MLRHILLALMIAPFVANPLAAPVPQAATRVPTVDDLLNVSSLGSPQISPDGTWVAYTVTSTDWKQDAFVTQIWAAHVASGRRYQLTRGDKPCSNPQWSPDSTWLAFTSARVGDKNQVFAIRPDGGEAIQLTNVENGAGNYAWSRDGKQIAFTSSDAKERDTKARKDHLGDFEVVRKEYAHQHLRTLTVSEAMESPVAGAERTKGRDFTVSSFSWSPDGTRIAFSATVNPDLIQGGPPTSTSSTSQPTPSASSSTSRAPTPPAVVAGRPLARLLVGDGKPDVLPRQQPPRCRLRRRRRLRAPSPTPSTSRPACSSGTTTACTSARRRRRRRTCSAWTPATGAVTRGSASQIRLMLGGGSCSATARRSLSWPGRRPAWADLRHRRSAVRAAHAHLDDRPGNGLHPGPARGHRLEQQGRHAHRGRAHQAAPTSTRRRSTPSLCIIHGGPTGVDRPTMIDTRIYPVDIWTSRGALILKVNYRGSAGTVRSSVSRRAQPRRGRRLGRTCSAWSTW